MDPLLGFLRHSVKTLEKDFEQAADPPSQHDMDLFSKGTFQHIKASARGAPADIKNVIESELLPFWNIRTEEFKVEHVDAAELHKALERLINRFESKRDITNLPSATRALNGDGYNYAAQGKTVYASTFTPTPQRRRVVPHVAQPVGQGPMPTTLEAAAQRLWDIETPYRLYVGKGFELETQGHAKYSGDAAAKQLFRFVDAKFLRRPTVKTFVALLDNYERELGKVETFTPQEKVEMKQFLDCLMETPHMKFLHEFLKSKHLCGPNLSDLHHLLFDLWFAPYRRKMNNDSSGFEHVFVGEEKDGQITGFHNWIQFFIEEEKGLADYLGWTGARPDMDDKTTPAVISCKFRWDDDDPNIEIKNISTFLVGTTPEFEMALLTLVFLTGQDGKNWIELGGQGLNVTVHKFNTRFGTKIGSSFVEL